MLVSADLALSVCFCTCNPCGCDATEALFVSARRWEKGGAHFRHDFQMLRGPGRGAGGQVYFFHTAQKVPEGVIWAKVQTCSFLY